MTIQGMLYDNFADPMELEDGQYAWRTRFVNVGAQMDFAHDVRLISQLMSGTTEMGERLANGNHMVDAGFHSAFVLLTKRIDKARLTSRLDWFQVQDNSLKSQDNNDERGFAAMVSASHEFSDAISLVGEWLYTDSVRPAREDLGLGAAQTDNLVQISLRIDF